MPEIKFELKFSFPAVLAVILLTDTEGTAFFCLLACGLHEMGHIAVMLLTGKPPEKISLYGGGIRLTGGLKTIPVIISGCSVNFLLFVIFWFLGKSYDFKLFGMINLLTGIFNLMPIQPLDGYNLIEKLIIRIVPVEKVSFIMRITEITASLLAAPLIILFFLNGKMNFSSVIFLFYIFVVDIIENL